MEPDRGRPSGIDDLAAQLAKAEESLAHLVRLQESILECAGEGIYGTDSDGRITFVNPAAAALLGWQPEELVGRPAHETVHHSRSDGTPYPPAECAIHRSLALNRVYHSEDDSFWRKDGTRFPISFTCTPIVDEGEVVGGVLVFRDITERKEAQRAQKLKEQLELQVAHMQKMETLGQLVGEITHDLNNLLAVIQNYAAFVRADLPEGPISNDIDQVLRATRRAAALTRQLVMFSRREAVAPRVVDLNEVVLDMEKLLRRTIPAAVRVSTQVSASLWPIKVDIGQLEQVIMNLVLNAKDAMPEGGHLTLSTENVVVDPLRGRNEPPVPGRFVRLRVSDTGSGIPPELQRRVFEPFFTSKARGNGTGLGLATVRAHVERAGGYIAFDSVPGRGTTFDVYLPAVHAEVDLTDVEVIVPGRGGSRRAPAPDEGAS